MTEEQGKWMLVGKSKGPRGTEASAAGAGEAANPRREEGEVLAHGHCRDLPGRSNRPAPF